MCKKLSRFRIKRKFIGAAAPKKTTTTPVPVCNKLNFDVNFLPEKPAEIVGICFVECEALLQRRRRRFLHHRRDQNVLQGTVGHAAAEVRRVRPQHHARR